MPLLDINTIPVAPDYELPKGWLAKPIAPATPVDVFFVYPMDMFNDTGWIMDTTRLDMHAAASCQDLTGHGSNRLC